MYNIFWKIRETYDSVFDDVTWHWGENLNNSTIEWMNQEINKRFNENNITPFVVSQEKMMAVLKR